MRGGGDGSGGSGGVVTLRGLTVRSSGPNDDWVYHGIIVHSGGSAVMEVCDVSCSATKGFGILVRGSSTRVAVINTKVHHSGLSGVIVQDGGIASVMGCYIEANGNSGVAVTLKGSRCEAVRYSWLQDDC